MFPVRRIRHMATTKKLNQCLEWTQSAIVATKRQGDFTIHTKEQNYPTCEVEVNDFINRRIAGWRQTFIANNLNQVVVNLKELRNESIRQEGN